MKPIPPLPTVEGDVRRPGPQRTPNLLNYLSAALLALTLTSCSTAQFYHQAVAGQVQILAGRKPVATLLADPHTEPRLRDRLKLTQDLRAFAEKELGLPSGKAYATYTDLHRPHVAWVVVAAPEFSTRPYQWHYPILGKLDYRGYFKEADAKECARSLKARGLETAVGGVDAYSSLGYFNDPLLNTFIHDPDPDLAELLFHELTHRKVFLSGDTEFNEAFATATGQEGARRWLRSRQRWDDLRKYEKSCSQEQYFAEAVLETKRQLEEIYQQPLLSKSVMRQRKQALLKALGNTIRHMPELAGHKGYTKWATQPINHARMNTVSAYHRLVPAFQQLLATCHGDLARFYEKIAAMKSLSQAERRGALGVPHQ